MEGISWSLREQARLMDAVKKFKAKHGHEQIDWKILTQKADLTRFTSIQVRQKYTNLKRKERPKVKARPSTEARNQLRNFSAEELAVIRRVRPTTTLNLEFKKFLGYGKDDPTKTLKTFLDRIHSAVKSGELDGDWVNELNRKASTLNSFSREFRRDMAKLRNEGVMSVPGERPINPMFEQVQRRRTCSKGGATNVVLAEIRPAELQSIGECISQPSVPVVGASAQPKIAPVAGQSKTKYTLQGSLEQMPQKSSETQNLVYNEVISGPYGVLLPTPTGIGYQHVLRKLTDNEWRKMILEMRRSHFHICSNEYLWKKMTDKAGINCSLRGSEIQTEFCKYAIPRFKELMSDLEEYGNPEEFDQLLTESSRLTDMIIFHSMKGLQFKEIMPTIRSLEKMKIVSAHEISLREWCKIFISSVLRESKNYFSCSEEQVQKLRENVIERSVELF